MTAARSSSRIFWWRLGICNGQIHDNLNGKLVSRSVYTSPLTCSTVLGKPVQSNGKLVSRSVYTSPLTCDTVLGKPAQSNGKLVSRSVYTSPLTCSTVLGKPAQSDGSRFMLLLLIKHSRYPSTATDKYSDMNQLFNQLHLILLPSSEYKTFHLRRFPPNLVNNSLCVNQVSCLVKNFILYYYCDKINIF
jgi:hypothetical protein